MPNDFNDQIIKEFRANGGRVGGMFEDARLLLLTTVGSKSGVAHTVPLGYLPDGDRVLVIASAAGAAHNPAWFHNLTASPEVTVEAGPFTYQAQAVVLEKAERDEIFARAVEVDPGWASYQAATTRVLPVVALLQVSGGPPAAESWGAALVLIHDAFRLELARIRAEIARSGPGLGAQLRVNCLSVCQGLTHHHTGEDTGLFVFLAEHHPELAPVIDRLSSEHHTIADLIAELAKVISTENADRLVVSAEVDRLTSEVEKHLKYEEEQLIPILDSAMP